MTTARRGGEHGAGPVDGLVGAAEPGGRVGGDHRCPSPAWGHAAVAGLSTAEHTDTDDYAPVFWHLTSEPSPAEDTDPP